MEVALLLAATHIQWFCALGFNSLHFWLDSNRRLIPLIPNKKCAQNGHFYFSFISQVRGGTPKGPNCAGLASKTLMASRSLGTTKIPTIKLGLFCQWLVLPVACFASGRRPFLDTWSCALWPKIKGPSVEQVLAKCHSCGGIRVDSLH